LKEKLRKEAAEAVAVKKRDAARAYKEVGPALSPIP